MDIQSNNVTCLTKHKPYGCTTIDDCHTLLTKSDLNYNIKHVVKPHKAHVAQELKAQMIRINALSFLYNIDWSSRANTY